MPTPPGPGQIDRTASAGHRTWPAAALLAAAIVGFALLATIALMGPTTLAAMRLPWLACFLVSLAGTSLWWCIYLWVLNHLADLSSAEGVSRSVAPMALLSLSLFPDLAVFLAGKLPYTLAFDADMRSLFIWMAGSLLFVVFVGQELVLAGAIVPKGLHGLVAESLRHLTAFPGWIRRQPEWTLRQLRHHPLLMAILLAGIVQRMAVINEAHAGDMNSILTVTYSLLSWPPFGYYHYYSPQTYMYGHLPFYPMLVAPFYWLFENVAKLPTLWAAKLISALADLVIAALIYSRAGARWKRLWGPTLAACWLLAPWVVQSDDHAVPTAAAFAVAALATLNRSWLCGIMIALGAATRDEVAFLALPLIVHFAMKRDLRETVAFLGAFSTTLATVALPFFLSDPNGLLHAMGLQSGVQAVGEISSMAALLQPHLSPQLNMLLQQNAGLVLAVLTLLASLLAIWDGRAPRVVLVVALAYLLAVPVLHPRYTLWAYAGGLFYAGRYGNPLIAVAIAAAVWPSGVWASTVQVGLAAVLVAFGLLQPGRPKGSELVP